MYIARSISTLIHLITLTLLVFTSHNLFASERPKYQNASLPIEARVEDLLKRMTLEEKTAQLHAVWLKRRDLETEAGVFSDKKAQELLGQGIGQIARPSENKSPVTPNKTPEQTINFVNASQKWILENTRLGIPAIYHEEALHGHAARDATSFPQAIGLASTWDANLVEDIYTVIAAETRKRGGSQALTPILDVARDPRWGRIEETMGEDPYLVANLGVASVKGFQGATKDAIGHNRVIATLKHMAGHGEPTGGLNTAPAPIGERTLREIFLFPFEAAIKLAGARSVMASYNEIDGIPSHANDKMMNGILRNEWGFEGVVVSDYFAIGELATRHGIVKGKAQAAALALKSGIDVELPDGDTYLLLPKLVNAGKISQATVDQAVRRVLHEKFLLGLFEAPYTSLKGADEFIGNPTHRALALKAAEKAIILLKNDNNQLPLDAASLKTIAVIGPHANEALLGGYSDVPKNSISILQGIRNYLGEDVKVHYAQGTHLTLNNWDIGADSSAVQSFSKERWHKDSVTLATAKDTKGMIKKAVHAAKKSQVAVLVLGDNEATSREAWAETHLGDRTRLDLFGRQQELVDAIVATGKPVIVIMINGRPLSITKLSKSVPAILEGWYLGQETGTAVARILFGDANPGAKLPLSIPRSVGHIPAYYNYKPTAKRGYAFDQTASLYPFGHGLSYSTFEYSDISVSKNNAAAGETIEISFTLKNTGHRAGDEVAQLYIRDTVASLTRPVKELKGFKRVSLKGGESARVTFGLSVNQLGFYGHEMQYIVEPGEIQLMVGSSSEDIRLTSKFDITGRTKNIEKTKVFFSTVQVRPHTP